MKFDERGLVPMIIQDVQTKQVLSLVYGTKESIKKMKETGFVWRYSRAQGKVMQKGEESGNVQKVISVTKDCDSDTLLVTVEPKGPACHKGTVSCFQFPVLGFPPQVSFVGTSTLEKVEAIIEDRVQNPKKGSYTNKVLAEDILLVKKLREELEELITFKDRKNLIWEAADLSYFLMVFLAKNKIKLAEVEKELERRMTQ